MNNEQKPPKPFQWILAVKLTFGIMAIIGLGCFICGFLWSILALYLSKNWLPPTLFLLGVILLIIGVTADETIARKIKKNP